MATSAAAALAARRGAAAGARPRGFAVLAHAWTKAPEQPAQAHSAPKPSHGHKGRQRVCVMMHGILGSRSNWNTPARRLLHDIGPLGWRVLQLDHRAHGQSPAGEPPHTIEACAQDVLETLAAAGVHVEGPGADELVVCGHSFGGKVALAVLQALLDRGAPPPRRTWLFDSVPGRPARLSAEVSRREQSVDFVLGVVERAAARGLYADRAALVEALEKEHGLSTPLAGWVAQSVRYAPEGVALSYDVETVRALYDAYQGTDFWHLLEGGRADVGVVVAGRNRHAWGDENMRRLDGVGHGRLHRAMLKNAGHNVHVDDLPGLLDTVRPTFV